jgi:hypothetical protein
MLLQEGHCKFILRTAEREIELKLAPMGWSKFSSSWKMANSPFGYDVKYSTSALRFVEEGAVFLRQELDKYGVNAEVEFIVLQQDSRAEYQPSFSARIDFFANYVNERDFFECDVYDAGFKQAYSQYMKTKYEIPIDDTAEEIQITQGIQLYEQVTSVFEGGTRTNRPAVLPVYFTFTGTPLVVTKGIKFNANSDANTKGFVQVLKGNTIDLTMKIYVNFRSTNTDAMIFKIRRNVEGTNIYTDSVIFEIPKNYFLDNSSYDKSFELNISSDDNANVGYYIGIDIENEKAWINIVGTMKVEYFGYVNTGPFSLKAIKFDKVGDALVKNVYPPARFSQEFIDDHDAALFITTADAIKGVTKDEVFGIIGPRIKTSLQDFYENIGCLFDVGIKVFNEDNLVQMVDKRAIFNRDNHLLDLGNVTEMRIKSLDDFLLNEVSVGYEKQEYNYPLGRQEFANELLFTNALKVSSKALDKVCKYRADYTGVHLLHYDYTNNPKKDTKTDDSIFLLWAVKNYETNKWEASDAGIVVHAGLEGGGYFNLTISPHRNLRRQAAYFASIMDKLNPKEFIYRSSNETQSDLVSKYQNQLLVEKSDEDFTGTDILFKPIYFEFDCIVPKNLTQFVGENPSGYFTFEFNNIKLKGFPLEMAGNYSDSSQRIKCIAHPDTPDNIQELLFKR